MDKLEFAKSIHVLEKGLGKKLQTDQLDIWFECLSDLSVQQLQGAIIGYLQNGDDWPSIAKLRRFAGMAGISDDDRAESAWATIFRSVSKIGGYESVDFSDPLVNATIRSMGGWQWLTEQPTSEFKWLKKDFVKTYRAFLSAGISGEICRHLPGLTAASRTATGYEPDEPVKIECDLPAHRPGLIRGDVPRRTITDQTATKAITQVANKRSVADIDLEFERPQKQPEAPQKHLRSI